MKIIKTNQEHEEAIKDGYTVLIGGVNYVGLGSGYIACTWKTLREIFRDVTGVEYDENDGTHGIAMPIFETLGMDKLFN